MSCLMIGLIADTHGLLRPSALEALAGADHIVHAGDIGKHNGDSAGVLGALAQLAPLTVVRGNNDRADWAVPIPYTANLEFGGVKLHALHILADLAIDPVREGVQVIVSGHSHQPRIETLDSVLYVNPGSAGPRRFKLPISVARLWIENGRAKAELVDLLS
jgi:putative phosphoesterase